MKISEKAAYLMGMADSIDLDMNDKKDKLISELVKTVNDMASYITGLDDAVNTLSDTIDEIDMDLGAVEEEVYDYDDDCGCDCCDDDCDCDCCDSAVATCPNCGADIELDFDAIQDGDSLSCPQCGTELNFEFVDDEDEAGTDE